MSFDENWESSIYSNNKHINRYPYGELVSMFFQGLKLLCSSKEKSDIKVLELGCGSGNNLWFIAEQGFDTYGVDGSDSACETAKKQCKKRGVNVHIEQAYFDKLPFEDSSMDMIIDRESTYCGTLDDIKNTWCEANRVLKSGGVVVSFMFSSDHPMCERANKESSLASKIENNTFKDFKEGSFKDTGIVHFTSMYEINDILSFWT